MNKIQTSWFAAMNSSISNSLSFCGVLVCLCLVGFSNGSILKFPSKKLKEVHDYQGIAEKIINFTTTGKGKGQVYNRLAEFVDKFGNRIAGSNNLENAIDYMLDTLKKAGLENVHGENVTVPHWVRGNESATMLEPRRYNIALMGLGSSIGTPEEGITAEVLVVRSFDELKKKADQAKGKIVVFNEGYKGYATSVAYRDYSAKETAKVGGVASLIRSVASLSIHSPHTGWQDYDDKIKKIPTACIAVEDAEMLDRMASRGTKIVIHLKMDAKNLPPVKSRNTVAEIRGSKYPDQVVLISGHLDSWDVGQGAMDDGGGAFISWQALSIMQQLGLRPKRTVRAVLWTAEEVGLVGSQQYYQRHKVNISNYDFVMESDQGTFKPYGIQFTGSPEATAIMKDVVSLLSSINSTKLSGDSVGGDISFWVQNGVPGGSLLNENERYFWFHHSDGDTMSVQDPHEMDLCAAVWTVVTYVVADLDEMLPR